MVSVMANPIPLKDKPELLEKIQAVGWLPICDPIVDKLVYLKVPYWGFDNQLHEGELLIHQDTAADLSDIFNKLAKTKFPIEKIQTIDAYQNDDDSSMADNNTSAFNCRAMTNNPKRLSYHASGIAIDINPKLNPWVKGDTVYPANGKAYANRSEIKPGMISHDSLIYQLFKEKGWEWGGDWLTLKDYQHFEKKSILDE